jgi:hypothetical protein
MTKKCKSCQTDIDIKAKKCPNCKADQRNWFARHPIITGIVALIVVFGVIGAASGSKSTPSNTSSSTSSSTNSNSNANTAVQQTAQPTPMVVDATALVGEYDKNKLAAQDKYTGKRLQLTSYIDNISSDITGNYYLSLKPSNDQYYSGTTIQCYFADKSQLTSLANGQSVTVSGTAQDMTLGIVELKDCSVIK